ncbi:MerR family transcriptional regulator [Chitinophaga sp. MM2321]|uniref:MerR family transcriptional regulator n=1 Tax=Chitinophaga sp. MM2321 TaxID=3137178 RepID=UPI0032D583F6
MPGINSFTIKDIEHFTGIKAHTIRIWEQRYQLLPPKRKDTNHRVYDNKDLKGLLRIAYLYHHGMKISRIAALSEAQQNKLSVEIAAGDNQYELYINELIEATLDYDQLRFEIIFQQLVQLAGFEKSITHAIYPYLEKVGILWLTGSVTPAQEHFSSQIIRTKILVAIDSQEMNDQADDHFLLFLPEGEFHEIPLLYVHYLLKKHRKIVTNFGANIPLSDLKPFVAAKKVTHIYTHMLTNMTRKAMNSFAEKLGNMYPHINILLSGPQTKHISMSLPANMRIMHSLKELERML